MKTIRTIRSTAHSMRRAATLTLTALGASGCFGDSSTGPEHAGGEAPSLPAPERLTFDLCFFESNPVNERSAKRNFFNAYVRTVTVGAITHLVLATPVTAFSLALHTVPSPQDDGSYLWIYTFVDGAEGSWHFSDFELGSEADAARIDWGVDENGEFLRFTDLHENVGDQLELRSHGHDARITSVDADHLENEWFIRWNEATGSGSLKAPDLEGGVGSCWDERQNDVVCGTPAS